MFEDNSGTLEMEKVHKYRPHTKHLSVKLHHFRDYVERGKITIKEIGTKFQLADYLTKPLDKRSLRLLRQKVMGWLLLQLARGSVRIINPCPMSADIGMLTGGTSPE